MSFIVRNLLFHYETKAAVPASPSLDLTGYELLLPSSGKVALLGESGSGKSTLLNVLGLLWDKSPTAGEVSLEGENLPLQQLPADDQARLRREEFGFVFQSSYLLRHFTVRQNIAIPLELLGIDRDLQKGRVDGLLRAARLDHLADKLAHKLSGGEQQRVAVLRAIVHDPRILFADEPASNLDRRNSEIVLSLLKDWTEGKHSYQTKRPERALFFVSHSLREVRKIETDHLLLLYDGEVVGKRLYPGTLDDESIYNAIEYGIEPESIATPVFKDS